MRNEADVKKAVKKLFKKYGWMHWMPGQTGRGVNGVSDFIAVKQGRILAIETKFGDNKATPLQAKFIRNIRAHGGVAAVVHERNLDMLENWLVEFDVNTRKNEKRTAES